MENESVMLLEQPFSEEKVWGVIQKSNDNKAPGSDGVNMNFIKN